MKILLLKQTGCNSSKDAPHFWLSIPSACFVLKISTKWTTNSTKYALLSLIESWKNILDKKGFGGAILVDLSKALDPLNY